MMGEATNRTRSVIAVGIVIALLVPSLGYLGGLGIAKAQDEVPPFRIGMLQPIGSLNPFTAIEDSDYIVFNAVYDRLTTWSEDWEPKENLAEDWRVLSWEAADDPQTEADEGANRHWQYDVRDGVQWHDGQPFTAEDVNYTLNLNLNEDPRFWAFTPYISPQIFDHAEVNKTSTSTVDLYLKVPCLQIDTMSLPIVPKHIFGEMTPDEVLDFTNDHPIGTGPFKFVEYVTGDHVTLVANENYTWGKPKIETLQIVFYGSDQVMAEALKAGDIEIARFPRALTYDSLKDQANISTAEVRANYWSDIGFNCYPDAPSSVNPLLRDENVRQAIHYATNKQFLIDIVFGGYADEGTGLTFKATPQWWFDPGDDKFEFNLTKANETLDAAGYDWNNQHTVRVAGPGNPYANPNTPLEFELLVINTAPEDVATAPYLKAWWEIVGVNVDIIYLDENELETRIYWNADHEIYLWYWSGMPDPRYILEVQTSNEIWGWSDNFWTNETYDALYMEQLNQTGATRNATIQQMLRINYLSSPFIVTAYPWFLFAYRTDKWTGWGDLSAHPGRSYWFYYQPNAMLMEVEPIGAEEGGGGVSDAVIIAVAIVVLVAIVAIASYFLLKKKPEEPARPSEPTP